ncbi:Ribosomal RNA small subunit methyltransferase H, partial [Dissostichus eleginoides]
SGLPEKRVIETVLTAYFECPSLGHAQPDPHPPPGKKSLEEKVPCPICFESFTPRDQHVRLDDKTDMGQNNGKAMETQFERGLLQWQRQKGSSPTATLNVTFFGEAGVDTGALRKEFLTVVAGIEGRFFEGPQQQRIPRGHINQKVLNSDSVADVQLRDTIVRAIILHAVLRLQPMLEQLREGLQLYGLLSLMSQYPDICQPLFVSGEDVKVNAEFVMTSILPQLSDKGTTRHQVELEMMNFIQDFLYEAEDHGHVDKDGLHPITPATFLQWITGQGHVPLLPSKKDFAVVIQFNHDCSADFGPHSVCYPVVTACAKTITLPVRHMRPYEKFKNILTEAFQLGQEFSNV